MGLLIVQEEDAFGVHRRNRIHDSLVLLAVAGRVPEYLLEGGDLVLEDGYIFAEFDH